MAGRDTRDGRRRRERRLRSWLRHEWQTVAMELAAALHRSRDGRGQTTASPGTRPSVLKEPEAQVAAVTVGYVAAGAPLLAQTASTAPLSRSSCGWRSRRRMRRRTRRRGGKWWKSGRGSVSSPRCLLCRVSSGLRHRSAGARSSLPRLLPQLTLSSQPGRRKRKKRRREKEAASLLLLVFLHCRSLCSSNSLFARHHRPWLQSYG